MKIKFRYKRFLGILLVCYLGIGFTSSEFSISSNDIKKLKEIAAATSSNSNILILPIEGDIEVDRWRWTGQPDDFFFPDAIVFSRPVAYALRTATDPSVGSNKYSVNPSFSSNCNNFLSIVHPSTALPENSSPEVNSIVSVLPRTTRGAEFLKFLCENGKNLTTYQVSDPDYLPLTRFTFSVGESRIVAFYVRFHNTIILPGDVWRQYLREDLCFRIDTSYFRRSFNTPR